jgi:predicted Rossmann fold flavoprotein
VKTHKDYQVVIIGGGASGMIAAIAAASSGKSVVILEKNKRLGEKLRITGGGRCNIWNEEHNERLLLSNYGDNNKFLFSSFARFGLSETIDFFHNLGLDTKVEAKKRAFPASEKADDVVLALENKLKQLNVKVCFNESVTSIGFENGKITNIKTATSEYLADSYILATGGKSRPETGSTGDGFKFLKQIGHTVVEPTPTITPLEVKEAWIKKLSGTTLEKVRITFRSEHAKPLKLEGNILCTHFGMSGPLILNNAYKVEELLKNGSVQAHIDVYPSMNEKELDGLVVSTLEPHGAKQLKNTLRYILPAGTLPAFKILLLGINFDMNTADLTKEQRLHIVRTLKDMPCTITQLMGYDKAVVADGGIKISEIDMKTMRSKIASNIYVTGDLLHINRPSGGYSLQLCWTSGYLAGISA